MNNYITLNSKQYLCPAKEWKRVFSKPSTIRKTLAGSTDVTYGAAAFEEWRGQIEAPYYAASPWGTISDLETVIQLLTSCSFTDHYGNTSTVHVVGPEFTETSLMAMWDSASNKFYIPVRLVKV